MNALDIFALIVLIVLVAAGVAVWVVLGLLPGRIARSRRHPQADAISVCGWWGVITMGLLLPVAWIWAYTNPEATLSGRPESSPVPDPDTGGEAA
jgi:hypothetical protein